MIKKIILTGPESTGKSTLSEFLADHFNCPLVSEFARDYLTSLGRTYVEADLLEIAKGQWQRQIQAEDAHSAWLFLDTSLLNIKIWSNYKYGRCDPWIVEQLDRQGKRGSTLWLLCGTDIPWEFDPMRENPGEREELYGLFKKELEEMGAEFLEVFGSKKQRGEMAIKALTNNCNSNEKA